MTFLEACQKLVIRSGMNKTGPASVIGQTGEMKLAVQWTADAYKEICNKWLNWKFLWARHSADTVSGQSTILPPDDLGIWDFSTIRLQGQRLDVVEYEQVKDFFAASVQQGEPTMAIIMPDNSLLLDPVPDKAYLVTTDYFRVAPRPTNNTDTLLIPENFQDAILGRAMMFYAGFENAAEVRQEGLELYQIVMRQLEDHQLPSDGYRNGVSTGSMDIRVIPS